jgi:class 3 adenylate cyclase
MNEPVVPLALPGNPVLAAWASAVNEAGYWAYILDAAWRLVFVTDDLLMSLRNAGGQTAVPIGSHFYSTESMDFYWSGTALAPIRRAMFKDVGGYVLAATPGGREQLRNLVDPELADLVDELQPQELEAVSVHSRYAFAGTDAVGSRTLFRIDDHHGQQVGLCLMFKPGAPMSELVAARATADLTHLERMRSVERADRRSAAILMADLEASSPLARHLSTAQYFAFGRRLVRTADRCIINEGGIVGRHVGDGVVAYFLPDTTGSESATVRSCITAARSLRDALADIATRSELADVDLSLRFGLHWGASLYIGRVLTAGRSEVTALGDEMNEAARIEACATGGRTLASKSLLERLNREDAAALGIDTAHLKYTPLGDLSTATEKVRRDAPSIAVCEL